AARSARSGPRRPDPVDASNDWNRRTPVTVTKESGSSGSAGLRLAAHESHTRHGRNHHVSENRLKNSASPYLRSAAHQPIDWHEWGESAFTRAKAEDKPILLDIGAVWCHWCHVIDRESYENPEIAKIINEHFVPVKVDRDERPDVDSRYQ